MQTYRVTLSPLSKLETLHDSQNLFGFLCYQIKERYDEATLEQTLANVRTNQRVLRISSIMPEASVFWPAFTVKYSSNETFDTVIAKKLKKINYVSMRVLDALLESDYIGDAIVKNIRSGNWEFNKDLLMEKNEIFYEYSLGIDIRFSSQEQTPFNVKSYGVQQNSRFTFFVTTDIEEVIQTLHSLEYISLGKYKNVALNTYEVIGCETTDLVPAATNILVSKYIPADDDEFDRDHSMVKIDLAKSRLDNRMLQTYDTAHLDAFSLITEGSMIVSKNHVVGILKHRDQASEILGKPVYYNGLAFLYPVGDAQ